MNKTMDRPGSYDELLRQVSELQEQLQLNEDKIFQYQLSRNETLNYTLLNKLPLLISAKEASSGRYLYWNKQLEQLHGLSAAEAMGKNAEELFPKERAYLTLLGDREALQSPDPVIVDNWKWPGQDGKIYVFRVVKSALKLADERRIILAFAEDVTKRFEAEDLLQEQRNLTRAVLDSVDYQVAVINDQGVITHVNKAWIDFGRKNGIEDFSRIGPGTNYFSCCKCEIDADFAYKGCISCMTTAGIQQVIEGKESKFSIEYDCSSPEEQRYFLLEATPLLSCRGKGAVLSHIDITQQKITEALLHENHQRSEQLVRQRTAELQLFENIFKSALEGITVTDAEGSIINVNQAFCDITGYDRDDVIGRNPRILKSDRHQDRFYQRMWQQLNHQGFWEGEIWNRRKNGEIYPEWLTINTMKGENGNISNYVAVFHDISHIKEKDNKIKQLAYEDPLTGLPNRSLMLDRLNLALDSVKRKDHQIAVLHLDIDHFKNINKLYGYPVGDDLLCSLARHLESQVRDGETLAHLGGDDFVIISRFIKEQGVSALAERLSLSLEQPLVVKDQRIKINISIGIATSGKGWIDPYVLLQNADTALQQSKQAGRNCYRFFDRAINNRLLQQLTIEREIREAFSQREFVVHYQPQIEISSGQIVGVEALVRWQKQDHTMVRPDLFIPVAEEIGLIQDLDMYVLDQACSDILQLHQQGFNDLQLSVNFAAGHFQNGLLAEKIMTMLKKRHFNPAMLGIELTETGMMSDLEKTKDVLTQLGDYGFKIAVDDFGTGYSSLYYLKKLPLSALKIDRSFVQELSDEANDRAIIVAILTLAKALGLKTIAEGVELDSERLFLEQHGCDQIQGYYYSRPLPFSQLTDFLYDWRQTQTSSRLAQVS